MDFYENLKAKVNLESPLIFPKYEGMVSEYSLEDEGSKNMVLITSETKSPFHIFC